MDSINSGSLQSSSGADEECDSRATAVIPTHHHQPHPPPLPPSPFNHHHMFYQNQINNHHHHHHPLFFSPSPQHHQLTNLDLPSFSAHSTVPFSPATTVTTTTAPLTTNTVVGARNPKKRSRASRRAPTTVLTTDKSNFRAMVQEFTGIPAPPFTSSSSFDLFGRSNIINNNNFDNLPQLPSYLFPLFTQKLQSSSPSSISSLMDSNNLLTTMQNTVSFPCDSLNQSAFLNQKATQNVGSSLNGYGVVHELYNSLPDLVSTSKGSTAHRSTTITTRNDDSQVASGSWDGGGGGGSGGGGVDYIDGKESSSPVITDRHHSSGMKADHQGFIEPWICS